LLSSPLSNLHLPPGAQAPGARFGSLRGRSHALNPFLPLPHDCGDPWAKDRAVCRAHRCPEEAQWPLRPSRERLGLAILTPNFENRFRIWRWALLRFLVTAPNWARALPLP
jgi:hypothetical protein